MSEKTEPIRLGIIGCGLAVKWLHWPALKKLKEHFQVTVACDVEAQAAAEIAELAQKDLGQVCRTTGDYREVLAAKDVEAVLISLPIHLNAQIILECAQAGKHILAEKPLAANLEQAQQLAATMRGFKNIVVEVAENFHYRTDIQKAKEWLAAGKIGELFMLQLEARFWTNTNEGFASTLWRQDNQYRGGLVADGGVHYAAALRDLGGEVEQVQAFTRSIHPLVGEPDTIALNLRFRNGAIGIFSYTGGAKTTETSPMKALLLGTEGAIMLGNDKVVLTKGENQNAKVVEEFEIKDFDNGYAAEFDNFWRAIREGQPVRVTIDEALKDFTIIMRALDSAEMRSVILL